jgi:hypothetical protein
LLRVAEATEKKLGKNYLKMAGVLEVPLDVGLVMDVIVWARGHREAVKQIMKRKGR